MKQNVTKIEAQLLLALKCVDQIEKLVNKKKISCNNNHPLMYFEKPKQRSNGTSGIALKCNSCNNPIGLCTRGYYSCE